ncbi:GrpB family protein [Rhizobium sp. 1399]|uniref:GrpB family protein n=1 Tax=Rhizobium sp. 1399 TaxID=2817758 RepID=UPI002864DC52|nr:GrpB family protein [Rhizobium sp. 1399]MDR6667932.1 GrpB-like predicted nucleotidyltransferase (UPF0157 family) [Rhizobium sp. 1399]
MNRLTSAISSVDGTLMPTLVELSAFDPNWTNDFSAAEVLLRATLGKYVVSVDHIGSTAVPGLAAKPIIDIDITLSSLDDVPDASAELVKRGFESRGNRYDDDVWAFLWKRRIPQLRVYLCPPSNRTHERRMLFRDYLRQHEEVATEYAVLKRRLADQFPYDGDRYTSEKSAFISEIVGRVLNESWEDVTSGRPQEVDTQFSSFSDRS